MDGEITISNPKMMYDKQIEAVITFRKIRLEKSHAELTAKEKKYLLQMNEMKYRVAEGKTRDGIELKYIKYIVP